MASKVALTKFPRVLVCPVDEVKTVLVASILNGPVSLESIRLEATVLEDVAPTLDLCAQEAFAPMLMSIVADAGEGLLFYRFATPQTL